MDNQQEEQKNNTQNQNQQQDQPYQDEFGDEYVAIFYKCCGFTLVLFQFFLWFHTIYALVFEYFPFYFEDSPFLQYSLSIFCTVSIVCGLRALLLGNLYNSDATKYPNVVEELAKLNITNYENQCLPCNIIKSKDIHHCQICNRCILRLDHHCYFFGTCIGELNYRFFLTYIFTTLINGIVVILTLQPQMKLLVSFDFDQIQGRIWRLIVLYCLGWLFGVFFNSCLIFNHLYFLCNNIRYLEFKYQLRKPKYGFCRLIKIIFCCGDSNSTVIRDFHQNWTNVQQSSNYLRLFYPKFQRYNNLKFVELIRQQELEQGQNYDQPTNINNEMDLKLEINTTSRNNNEQNTDINSQINENQQIEMNNNINEDDNSPQQQQNDSQDNSESSSNSNENNYAAQPYNIQLQQI